VSLRVRFIEDRGFEPPQGKVFVEDDVSGLCACTERGFAGTWTLSEDKNDRKDGLWVWGLFEEPKYPFLYFYLNVFDSLVLPSGEEEPLFEGEGVPNNRLELRFSHSRDEASSVQLTAGEVAFKLTEMVSTDPFGIGGSVNIGDLVPCGSVQLLPQFNQRERDA